MVFTEMTHGFILAKFYVHLKESFGEAGIRTFIHATHHYGGQRGRRMAQRALRDGKELTYEAYMEYGEWVPTPESIESGRAIQSTVASISPDYVIHITQCPWHQQFKDMGLVEVGVEYCAHVDAALAWGFNPYMTYRVEQTLHESDHCVQRILNTHYKEMPNIVRKEENQRGFEYHCGHAYWAYNEVTASIWGERGEKANGKVLGDFAKTYGQGAADILAGYRYVNFNVC